MSHEMTDMELSERVCRALEIKPVKYALGWESGPTLYYPDPNLRQMLVDKDAKFAEWPQYEIYAEDGRRLKKRRLIGSRKEMSKTEALDRHEKWVRENVVAWGKIEERPTLRQLWERFTSEEKARHAKGKLSLQTVRQHISLWTHLLPLAEREAATITGAEIEALFDAAVTVRDKQPLSSESKSHLRNMTRQLLKVVGNNAVADAKLRFPHRKGMTLGAAQIRELRIQLPGDHDRLIFDVCVFVGLRASEAARLTRAHLRDDGMLDVPGTKTDAARDIVPINRDIDERLHALAATAYPGEPLLFAQKTHRQWLEKVLQPAGERCGIAHIDMLALRRTALTLMAAKDPSAAARLARHTSTQMVHEVYNNADLERVRAIQQQVYEEVSRVTVQ